MLESTMLPIALGVATLGAILASFITVIAERLYTGQSWRAGRSRCNSCREALGGKDLLPVISWLMYQGRCAYCSSKLPRVYVLGELSLALVFGLAAVTIPVGMPLIMFLAAACVIFFIVMYDLRHTVVPVGSSFLLLVASGGYLLSQSLTVREVGATLFMAGAIALFIFILHAFSRGRAMGLGDAPVAFSLALLVGSNVAFAGLLFSFWIGALFGVGILLARRDGPTMGIEVPFVPFLAAGFLLAFFTQWNPFPFIL